MITTSAEPYDYSFDFSSTALLCIDFQRDFVEPGGFGESLGNDVSRLRSAIAPTAPLFWSPISPTAGRPRW